MMNELPKHIVISLIIIILQIVMFNYLVLFNVATPFVFLVFVFMLPINLPNSVYYIICFLAGLLIDWFSSPLTLGIHAFSTLLAGSIRKPILFLISTSSSFSRNLDEISLAQQDYLWYALYLLPLIFIHHLSYFLLESYPIAFIGWTLLKIISSTIYTFSFTYFICILFYKK